MERTYYKKIGMQTIACRHIIDGKVCGKEFQAETRRTKYCPECKKLIKKEENKKLGEKRKREKISQIPKSAYKTKVIKLKSKPGIRRVKFVRKVKNQNDPV